MIVERVAAAIAPVAAAVALVLVVALQETQAPVLFPLTINRLELLPMLINGRAMPIGHEGMPRPNDVTVIASKLTTGIPTETICTNGRAGKLTESARRAGSRTPVGDRNSGRCRKTL